MSLTASPPWLYPITIPLSAFYGALVKLRHRLYDNHIFPSYKPPIPILSIGSITAGGAGKTPLSIWAIEQLLDKKLKVGYLSRGYRRKGKSQILVSNGQDLLVQSSADCGDEALQIANQFPEICVLNDVDRVSGSHALTELGCEVIVLDDGFQYRRLQKTLDWVILDTTLPSHSYRMLPLGYLRDTFFRLKFSHCIWLRTYRKNTIDHWISRIREFDGFSEIPIVPFQILPTSLIDTNKQKHPLNQVEEKKVVAFAGIAHPSRFLQQIHQLRCVLTGWFEFDDHHNYTEKDLQRLIRTFESSKADYFITTEKDFVKLPSLFRQFPILMLQVEVSLIRTDPKIHEQMNSLIRK
ncbi:MAG: tetraacyldisaccharide 4'-kinase [bacterium]|nr:tetraacyldisaccharide 4'-kinase [bacterium]